MPARMLECMGLVISLVLYWSDRTGNLFQFSDLEQAGLIGLFYAHLAYDESRGAKFSTYAHIRINASIIDMIRKEWPSFHYPIDDARDTDSGEDVVGTVGALQDIEAIQAAAENLDAKWRNALYDYVSGEQTDFGPKFYHRLSYCQDYLRVKVKLNHEVDRYGPKS